ncbi:MmcQ/YjbR family DNA-binding protein [Modestobacter sp. URMC 112]
MVTWEDVDRACLALPGTAVSTAHRNRGWSVGGRPAFAWERPLRRTELAELGDAAPSGPVLAVRVSDLDAKEALLAEEPGCCFTIRHFDGYAAVLVRLDELDADLLTELVTDAWVARAPKRMVAAHPEVGPQPPR